VQRSFHRRRRIARIPSRHNDSFAGARYLQRTSINLAAGAGLFWWEILAPGREARGELFEYEEFAMNISVSALGGGSPRRIFACGPGKKSVSSLARLGPYRYAATFTFVGWVLRHANGVTRKTNFKS